MSRPSAPNDLKGEFGAASAAVANEPPAMTPTIAAVKAITRLYMLKTPLEVKKNTVKKSYQ
jgi:hypothetical protein